MSDKFQSFELERMMSKWEHRVEYNLSESGVHPLSMRELVEDQDELEQLISTSLNYPQTNGTLELRQRIAALYADAKPENILVTNGCAEANFNTVRTLMQPGDEIVVMTPNYAQIWGIAENLGHPPRALPLIKNGGWSLDLEALQNVVSEKTKLIAVCTPNNPTGYILKQDEIDALVSAADRVGAWLLADEVYAGTEHASDEVTPSLWGRYDRVIAMGSLSKAYALPGLRIGWVVAPVEMVDDIWARMEYTTICATLLSNKLAAIALRPEVRSKLLNRTREYVRGGYKILEEWVDEQDGIFQVIPPQAAAIAFLRYKLEINSTQLVEHLIQDTSVFVAPGDHFGLDGFLRVSYGLPTDYLREGLSRIHAGVQSLG